MPLTPRRSAVFTMALNASGDSNADGELVGRKVSSLERVLGKLSPLFKALGINTIRECATWRSRKVSRADVSYSRLDGENSSSDSQSLTLQIWMGCCRHKRSRKYRATGETWIGAGYRESFEVNGGSRFTRRVWKSALMTLLHIQHPYWKNSICWLRICFEAW